VRVVVGFHVVEEPAAEQGSANGVAGIFGDVQNLEAELRDVPPHGGAVQQERLPQRRHIAIAVVSGKQASADVFRLIHRTDRQGRPEKQNKQAGKSKYVAQPGPHRSRNSSMERERRPGSRKIRRIPRKANTPATLREPEQEEEELE
jgi:hypothetical protein